MKARANTVLPAPISPRKRDDVALPRTALRPIAARRAVSVLALRHDHEIACATLASIAASAFMAGL